MAREGLALNLTISGLDQLKNELSVLAPDLKNKLLKSFRDAAKQVRTEAQSAVPNDPPMRGWRTAPAANPGKMFGKVPIARRTRTGGWPEWDSARIKAGIEYAAGVSAPGMGQAGNKNFGYRVYNASPQGNIVEIAGRKSPGQGTGVQFIQNLNRINSPGRLIYKAFDRNKESIEGQIVRDLDAIMGEYEKRWNSIS